jgi:predicted metal-dependent peptidase
MARQKQRQPVKSRALENFQQGYNLAREHPLFGPLLLRASVSRSEQGPYPREGWARVEPSGTIHVHPTRVAEPEEWLYVLAHCLLHLGFGHFQQRFQQREWEMACECVVWQFLSALKLGTPPEPLRNLPELGGPELPARTEETLFRYFCEEGMAADLASYSVTGTSFTDMIEGARKPPKYSYGTTAETWQQIFGQALVQAVSCAVGVAGGAALDARSGKRATPAQRARDWFVGSYPLLGALAATFSLIEEPAICGRLQISIAAVTDYAKELYFNPAAGLTEPECRFVMAHELLHVALRHSTRCRGRDPYLWNVACDFVINEWLAEMRIGSVPQVGLLLDATLKGLSAEAVYDRIVTDLRRFRRMGTFRGVGLGDILDAPSANWWATQSGVDLDAFYRNCLAQGLLYHHEQGRGLLPASLIEEIRALSQPPIPWEVELARWFDDRFPPLEKVRSYARPSRRQSSTPDIPRPSYVAAPLALDGRTFGVVLDTSGSMDRLLLGDCLGAIASYSESRDVPAARVVFCDALAYDAGYMRPDHIAGTVKVRGRGGTVLQPGIDLLERADDFPESGPILIVTDGFCDHFHVRREHAILLPEGRALPFAPRGKVFRIRRP